MLHAQLKEDMKTALKAREELRLSTLRGLLSALTNELVAQRRKPDELLEDDGVLSVIKRAVKQRKDSIEQFDKGGRTDLADKEKSEMEILEEYLPTQMSREDIGEAVVRVLETMPNAELRKAGIVVGAVMKELQGNADGAVVKEIVTDKLS
ncbi:glutamyl-tRNA amidotransferase [bacterium]|nr:glutamyl-tRNA amidotransferase [bacterium]|tara:strand:+ start:14686 stop:15138 length:453 start_codon:yes stop_codon:yes gene_type:complete